MANVLDRDKRLRVLAALVDGNSERATARLTEVSPITVGRFALRLGEGCTWLHNRLVRELACSLVEIDEQWSYVKKKQARVTAEDGDDVGEAWTWLGLDQTSRLAVSFFVGKRTEQDARVFVGDLRARLAVMPKLITSDGLAAYMMPIWDEFGPAVTYAQVIKNYRHGAQRGPDHRYEPPRDPFLTKRAVYGTPEMGRATTAHIERQNLTTRHFNGRMRRLCLAFSKKLDNHRAAAALCYVHYNFCHIVKTLRVTPAMAAGVTDHVYGLEEFMDAVLGAAACDAPAAQALAIPEPETTARALPNGRGFLRVVPSGGAPANLPPPPESSPTAPIVTTTAPVRSETDPGRQLDLFSWKPSPQQPKQLGLFDD